MVYLTWSKRVFVVVVVIVNTTDFQDRDFKFCGEAQQTSLLQGADNRKQ